MGSCQASLLSACSASSVVGHDMWDSGWLNSTALLTSEPPSPHCTEMLQYTTVFSHWDMESGSAAFPLLEKKHNCWQIAKHYCEANWISVPQLLMETGNVQRDLHCRASHHKSFNTLHSIWHPNGIRISPRHWKSLTVCLSVQRELQL